MCVVCGLESDCQEKKCEKFFAIEPPRLDVCSKNKVLGLGSARQNSTSMRQMIGRPPGVLGAMFWVFVL